MTRVLDVYEQNKRLGRGVNIRPTSNTRAPKRIDDSHFRMIKEAGFDSVRIVLNPWGAADASADQVLGPTWLQTMDWAVEQSLANGLMAILDLHEYGVMGRDPVGNHERFLETWRALGAHCKDLPESIVFELLNEPCRELNPELWNTYLKEAHEIVRETNPDRTLIIGPAFFNSINHLDELVLPEQDRNIILTVHYYSPGEFTHQGAPWSSHQDSVGVEWLGSESELAAIRDDFDRASSWAQTHDRPVYLGEFGAYDKADMASRVRWTSSVTREAEARGWSWGYWQFVSDFVLWDFQTEQWVQPILDALIPSQS